MRAFRCGHGACGAVLEWRGQFSTPPRSGPASRTPQTTGFGGRLLGGGRDAVGDVGGGLLERFEHRRDSRIPLAALADGRPDRAVDLEVAHPRDLHVGIAADERQRRHERHAQPRANRREDHLEVHRVEVGARLVALAPGRGDDEVEHGRGVAPDDPLLVAQLGEGDWAAAGKTVPRRKCEVDRLGQQLLALDTAIGEAGEQAPLVGDDHVQVAVLERRQRLLGLEVDHGNAQVGEARLQVSEGRHEQRSRAGGKRRDADPADDPFDAAAMSASARSMSARMRSVLSTSRSPMSVRRTPRPWRSSSWAPASRSSTAICCETADGVMNSASAAAAIVPRDATSRSMRRRVTLSIM